jgi:hypothetical protein
MHHGARLRGEVHDKTDVSRENWALALFNPDEPEFNFLRYSFGTPLVNFFNATSSSQSTDESRTSSNVIVS